MDDVDIANDRAQAELDARIAHARKSAFSQARVIDTCACGEPIPHVRQMLGYEICIACAAEREHANMIKRRTK